jgi:hypothetical protein
MTYPRPGYIFLFGNILYTLSDTAAEIIKHGLCCSTGKGQLVSGFSCTLPLGLCSFAVINHSHECNNFYESFCESLTLRVNLGGVPIHMFRKIFCFGFFVGTWVWTQSLALARQMSYNHLTEIKWDLKFESHVYSCMTFSNNEGLNLIHNPNCKMKAG